MNSSARLVPGAAVSGERALVEVDGGLRVAGEEAQQRGLLVGVRAQRRVLERDGDRRAFGELVLGGGVLARDQGDPGRDPQRLAPLARPRRRDGEDLVEPAPSLVQGAADHPVVAEIRRQRGAGEHLARGVDRPLQCRAQVGVIRRARAMVNLAPARRTPPTVCRTGAVVVAMPAVAGRRWRRSSRRSRAVLADGLQQPVAEVVRAAAGRATSDWRRGGRAGRDVVARSRRRRTPPRRRRGRSRRRRRPGGAAAAAPPAVQQVVAPVDQRAQRLLARQRRAAAAGQQRGSGRRGGRRSASTDSDAQRAPRPARCASGMPSSRAADLGDRGARSPPSARSPGCQPRARSTNRRDGLVRGQRRRRESASAVGHGQRRDRQHSRRRCRAARGWSPGRAGRAARAAARRPASAQASSRCSQLSSTSSSRAGRAGGRRSGRSSGSAGLLAHAERRPRRPARRSAGSASGPARRARRRPGSASGRVARATSSASRVLPTPPGPVSVTSRASSRRRMAARNSCRRPDEARDRLRQAGAPGNPPSLRRPGHRVTIVSSARPAGGCWLHAHGGQAVADVRGLRLRVRGQRARRVRGAFARAPDHDRARTRAVTTDRRADFVGRLAHDRLAVAGALQQRGPVAGRGRGLGTGDGVDAVVDDDMDVVLRGGVRDGRDDARAASATSRRRRSPTRCDPGCRARSRGRSRRRRPSCPAAGSRAGATRPRRPSGSS